MIDLNTCEKGDILISFHGLELEYVCKTPWDCYSHGGYWDILENAVKNLKDTFSGKTLDHVVRYPKTFGQGNYYEYGTRTNDGFVFAKNRNPKTDHDIVKIIKKNYE